MEKEFYKKQTNLVCELIEESRQFNYPSEVLVMLMKGNYIEGLDKNYAGKQVIDIGCGLGNNIVFLSSLELNVFGTEISEEIVNNTKSIVKAKGAKCDLRVGTNTQIPFEDNMFDYLISWNVIHYENSEDDMAQALNEYHRILKPGGRFFLQTGTPEHFIWKDSVRIDVHLRLIGKSDDYRKGKILYYFGTEEYLRKFLSKKFNDILIGRYTNDLFTKKFDLFVATGVKGK